MLEEDKQRPSFVPNAKQEKLLGELFMDFKEMREIKEKKYRFLGDKTPQKYWDEQEKRFVSYIPPKDISEDDWQANIVMGITRNAVLNQVSKTGMRVPETRIMSYAADGYVDDERSRIYQNLYKWSLRRESADKLQQYISLGNYVRGNVCVYEGFEDREIEVELVKDLYEDGEFETEKQIEKRWGPKRQIVPLNEIYFPNFFANDIQDQSCVIWRQIVPYATAKAEFGDNKNWKYVVPGNYTFGQETDSFFYSRSQLAKNQVEIFRKYGNPWKGGKDRYVCAVSGIPMHDMPLPFNHKKLPFSWAKNNPFSDKFMLGMGVPFMAMDSQDSSDAILNMLLDKNLLSMQKPVMTDDPDPNVRTYLSPGSMMQFTKGSTYQLAPLEGVTSGEMGLFQESMRQAREFSGAFGGGDAATFRGGKVTARQAVMAEEETKRLLGISMTNLEYLEKDLCVQRLANLQQFAPGSGHRIDVQGVALEGGKKGRFVAFLTESLKKANAMEYEDKALTNIEIAGDMAGQPTEAVAIAPEWFDLTDRLEAETVPESSYVSSRTLEQAIASEDYALLQANPLINQEELLRDLLKAKGKDAEKLISKQPPPMQPGMPGAQGGMPPGMAEAPSGPPGPLTSQVAGKGQEKALSAMLL